MQRQCKEFSEKTNHPNETHLYNVSNQPALLWGVGKRAAAGNYIYKSGRVIVHIRLKSILKLTRHSHE